VLLAETGSAVTSAEQLWKRDKIDERLICLPPARRCAKISSKKLVELGVDWFPSIEASSVDLIETYVANGLGIGVSVQFRKKRCRPTCARCLCGISTRRGGCDVAWAPDIVDAGFSGGNEIERSTADVSGAMTGESFTA